jgi:tetratricopeptide (TPR) repeat protein
MLTIGSVLLGLALGGAGSAEPDALAGEILALAALGDPASLERAAALVPEPLREDPEFRAAAANRALARFLAAASLRELSAASPDGAEGLRAARALREEALEELRVLVRAHPDDPAVAKALAVYLGLGGNAVELEGVARTARRGEAPGGGAADAWIDFAEVSAVARGRRPAEVEVLLAAFVARHQGILPARMSLARARLALGRREDALTTLDALLAAHPDHDAAKALKAELLAPPPVKMEVPVVPAGVPPPSRPGRLPRKVEPRRGEATWERFPH